MVGHLTTSSYVSGDNGNTETDVGETSTVAQSGSTPRDGQLWQSFTSSQQQLNAEPQRQDEMMELMGGYREQQEGPVPCSSNDVPARTISQRGSVSYKRRGSVPSAEGDGMEQPIAKYRRLHPPQQSHNLSPSYSQPPPPHPDPLTVAGSNVSVPHQNLGNWGLVPGHPNAQQIPPHGQGQVQGRPPSHPSNRNDQRMNPPPPRFPPPFPPPPYPILTLGQFRHQMGQTVGYPYWNSCTFSVGTSIGPSVRRLPPGWLHPVMTYQHPMYPPRWPQVHPRVPPQINPQVATQMNPQMPSQMQIRVPTAADRSAPSGPPPPYPGPGTVPEEPTPETTRTTPSTNRRRTSRTPGTSVVLRPRSPKQDPDNDLEDDDAGLYIMPVSRRKATGRSPARTNPPRKARPTNLTELGLDL